jgi:hypothetical protein
VQGSLDARRGSSTTLAGRLDLAIGRLGAWADSAATRRSSMRTVSKAPLSFDDGGDVEVSHAGVHNPTRVSIADVSACEHSGGRPGAAIATPTAAMG